MLDSSLLKTNFVGRDGFVWWIGRVAKKEAWRDESVDEEDGWSFRCKVRIIGYHTFDENQLKEDDLPWAHVMEDAYKGAGQGCLGSSSMMLGGETVFGFFLDGEDGQQPVIFGALARAIKPTEPYGPRNNSYSELGITGARDAVGETSRKVGDNNDSDTPKTNADNKVGVTTAINQNEFEGGFSTGNNVDIHAPKGLGPHTASNACENDAVSDITHAIGSFLTTVNGLTEFAGEYIDTARNTLVDIQQLLGKVVRIVNGAIKKIIRLLRDKVIKFLGKRFQDFIALIVPEPQQNPIAQAFKRIMDIIFCIFSKIGMDIKGMLMDLFKEMIGKALNPTVCAIEQTIGAIMGEVNDKINGLLGPLMGGLEWLTGALGGIGSLLGKVSSYVDMLLSFLACDALQCKKYDDWLQGEKGFKKPPTSWLNILNAQEKMNKPVEVSASNKSVFDTLSDGQINRILETPVGESSPEGLTVDADTKSQLEAYVGQQSGEKKKRWRLNNMFAKLNELALEDYPPNYGGKFSLLSILIISLKIAASPSLELLIILGI